MLQTRNIYFQTRTNYDSTYGNHVGGNNKNGSESKKCYMIFVSVAMLPIWRVTQRRMQKGDTLVPSPNPARHKYPHFDAKTSAGPLLIPYASFGCHIWNIYFSVFFLVFLICAVPSSGSKNHLPANIRSLTQSSQALRQSYWNIERTYLQYLCFVHLMEALGWFFDSDLQGIFFVPIKRSITIQWG